jgi:pyruvate dehydrogenase E2 component (dihydrolipoamide acetyltransferase)
MKKEGDRVEKDEVILVVMSEKIEYEVEAPESGNLAKIIAKEEENYPVGATLAVITAEGEEIPEDMLKEAVAPAVSAAKERVVKPPRPPRAAARVPGERLKISPVARKMAQELGVDVDALVGSGPGGRIVKEDVLKAAEGAASTVAETAPPAATPESDMDVLEVIPLKGIRKVIADRMQQSWDNTPRVTEVMEVDMTAAEAFRKENLPGWEKGFSTRVTYNDFIVKAVALALQEHPLLNSTIVNGEVRQFKDINVGVAVAVDEGLIVPVIQRAQRKTLIDISRESRALAEKAREKKLIPDDVARRTFSITNLGAFGVEIFTPIVNFPDNAILGVGKITRKPVVVDDEVVIRSMMYLSLVFNHMVVDGVPAARFLSRVKEILENPDILLS